MGFASLSTPWAVKLIFRLLLLQSCMTMVSAGFGDLFVNHEHTTPELLSFSREWWGLGPFRIGTREAIWGADPLAAYGGFTSLPINKSTSFRSSLTRNASLQWTSHLVDTHQSCRETAVAALNVSYTEIDWEAMQSVYGWSALQFQSWVRGELVNHANHVVRALVYPAGILEFYVNDQHVFGGDFYFFNRAPLVVDLKPGTNDFHVRLIRDVRATGGQTPPSIQAILRVKLTSKEVRVETTHAIVPDIVDGRLPSRYMSVPLLNTLDYSIEIKNCEGDGWSTESRLVPDDQLIVLVPGQTRPLTMEIKEGMSGDTVRGNLCYTVVQAEGLSSSHNISFSVPLTRRGVYDPHKFTFIHPSQGVSYAVIKAPRTESLSNKTWPPLVLLHGAGLEADSSLIRHALDQMPNLETFAIFPSGMSPWSGDDWHIWGLADVLASIDAVNDWVDAVEWKGTSISTDRVLIAGHSNGGQGTWFFASHLPDRTVAAAPASGYTSIENYVPYNMWSEANPLQSSILQMARTNFKNELLIENLLHIPVLQQHGTADDNVPPYHSRLMSSLRAELGSDSNYVEVAGRGHWWQGAMTTEPMKDFFERHLGADTGLTKLPPRFGLVSPATDEMGPLFGITIDQLDTPDYLGRLDVEVSGNTWDISIANVRKFTIDFRSLSYSPPEIIKLDQSSTRFLVKAHEIPVVFVKDLERCWTVEEPTHKSSLERHGAQRGALDAILRTKGPFKIVSHSKDTELALQISRNLLQYFGAEADVIADTLYDITTSPNSNIIRLVQGKHPSDFPAVSEFPVLFLPEGISLRDSASFKRLIPYQAGLGGVFLRPHINDQLELVVWGVDSEGIRLAARLVPTLTGGGQPDFVFLGRQTKRQGHGGVLAMGFFDYSWSISRSSFLP